MKKFFSLIAAVLFAGGMMATTVTKTVAELAVEKSFTNSAVCTPFDLDEVISVSTSATDANTGKYYSNGEQIRLYQTGAASITLTAAEGYKISSVTLTYASQNTGILVEAESGVAVDFENVQSATFTVGNSGTATNGQARITAFSVTYDADGGEVPPTPACDWDNIAYAGNGSGNADYTDRFKVCLGDPAPNFVNLQAPGWATEAGFYFEFPSAAWGAISLEEGEYQIQGAGILLFASAFLYDAEKEVTIVCQDVEYTITIKNNNPEVAPVTATTCAEVYQMAKNDVVDLLNDVVVTYANGKNVWVRDETASMLLYLSANTTWKAGDVLSGVAGVVDIYNGVTEIKPTAAQVAAVSATEGEAPAAIELAAVEAADVNKYIVMKNIAVNGTFAEGTASNITIANGEGTIVVRNNFKNGFAFDAEKAYDIYGVVTIYQSNPQIYFITAEEHVATAIDNTNAAVKATKVIENGKLVIIKNGVRFDATGARL